MSKKSLRPSNAVQVGNQDTGRVVRVGKRRQGGAWVREYLIRYDHSDAVRRVHGKFVRSALV